MSWPLASWTLRAKLGLLIVVAATLPASISAAWNLRLARLRLTESARELLSARADDLAGQLDVFHHRYARGTAKLARVPAITAYCAAAPEADAQLAPAALATLRAETLEDPAIWGLALLGAGGKARIATDAATLGDDLASRSFVREALEGQPFISSIFAPDATADFRPSIAFLEPVRKADGGAITGYLVLCVRATGLWALADASNGLAGPGSFAVLLDPDGIRVAHSARSDLAMVPCGPLPPERLASWTAERRFGSRTRELLANVQVLSEPYELARAAKPGQAMFRTFTPGNMAWNHGVARRLKRVPWTLVCLAPEAVVLSNLRELTGDQLAFVCAILVAALAVAAVASRRIVQPLSAISRAAESIAAGNLEARAPEGFGDDELGQLGRSFNLMADRVARDLATTERSEARFRELLEAAPDAVVIIDANGHIELVNAQTEKLFAYSRAELIGQPVEVLIPERMRADHPRYRDGYIRDPKVRRMGTGLELAGRRRDGSEFPVEISLSPIRTDGGLLIKSAIRDITARKLVEDELRRAKEATDASNRELEAFSASVAHDLRAPLRGMNGFAQVLLDNYGEKLDADAKDWLEEILLNAKKMGGLIDALLSLARLSRSELRLQTVDLTAMAHEAVGQLRRTAPERVVEVLIDDGLSAHADPVLARALLDNLLGNAWKFTALSEHARIEVGSRTEEGRTTFFVRDNGAGFDMAFASKLFSAFQRLHSAAEFPGTGIGLATAQRIVLRHGGSIRGEGTVDHGASFYFTLSRGSMGYS